jgi:ATP-dependent Lhr-like helicase
VIEETYRELLEDKLDVGAIEDVIEAIDAGEIAVRSQRLSSPTPRAFGLATLTASDVVLAEDESRVLQEFHERVLASIDDGEEGPRLPTDTDD